MQYFAWSERTSIESNYVFEFCMRNGPLCTIVSSSVTPHTVLPSLSVSSFPSPGLFTWITEFNSELGQWALTSCGHRVVLYCQLYIYLGSYIFCELLQWTMTSRRPMTRSFSGNGRTSSFSEEEGGSSNGRSESRNTYLSNVRPENR